MKRFAAGLVAALLLAGSPARASGEANRARCTITGAGSAALITGTAVAQGPAINTTLVCHVYLNGALVASIGGEGAGPVAVVAGQYGTLATGRMTVCAEAHYYYPDGESESWHC